MKKDSNFMDKSAPFVSCLQSSIKIAQKGGLTGIQTSF